jgi:hypothetical protein
MTEEQTQIIDAVFQRFIDSENQRPIWNPIDEAMYKLQWIDSDQLVREASIISYEHKHGKVRCNMQHNQSVCFAPKIVQAAQILLTDYESTRNLPAAHKYMLQYYLSLHHLKIIYTDENKTKT